jgi:hypothetical protein
LKPGHDHTRTYIVELVHVLQIRNVLENERVVYADLLADLLVHGVYVGLVDGHAFLGERGRVVNGYVVQLGMRGPKFV